MRFYWIRTHWLMRKLFPQYLWKLPGDEKKVYLTFDDGPIPEVTEFVLGQLREFNAKATFFCIGDNIHKHPWLFERIIADGHSFGNHTYNHLNGWHTPTPTYMENVGRCADEINALTNDYKLLMRPPYAKVKRSQSRLLRNMGYKIIMWDVLSADFDQTITPEQCLKNVLDNIRPGSIVIFHDSLKAYKNMQYALPATLQYLKQNGYNCLALD